MRRYRYYVCAQAQQRGWSSCPAPSLSAAEVEKFVVDQIRCIGRDPALVAATLVETRRQTDEAIQGLKRERATLERQRRVDAAEIGRLGASEGPGSAKQAEAQERAGAAVRRIGEIGEEINRLTAGRLDEEDVASSLAEFDAVWEMLTPREQATTIELLIEQVTYDAATDHLELTLRPSGLLTLGKELPSPEETAA